MPRNDTLPYRTVLVIFLAAFIFLSGCFRNPADDPTAITSEYYIITRPNGSTDVDIGDSLLITWTTPNRTKVSDYVQIDLFSEDSLVRQVTTRTYDDGNFNWSSVATPLGSGTEYRIRVADDDDPETRFAFSDYFSISSLYDGNIAVTFPDDDTLFSQGGIIPIRWDTSGSPGSLVKIELFLDSTMIYLITSSTQNNGAYSWSVQSTVASSDRYRIRVSSYYDYGIYDYSGYFTIEGLDPDTFEVDNSRNDADTLTHRLSQNRSLTLNDTDWVAISLSRDTTYIIQTSGNARARLYLYPAGSSSSIVSFLASSSGSGYFGYVEFTPDSTGIYFIRITPYSTSSSYLGSYTLTVIPITDQGTVTISNPDSTSVWASGSTYDIKWDTSGIGTSVSIKLFQGSALQSTIYSSTTNDGIQAWSVPASIQSGSNYQIHIADSYAPATFGRSDAFTISGLTPDEYEDDDSRSTASTMEVGATQEHSLYVNDTDWVAVSLLEDTTYLIQTAGAARTRIDLFAEGATSALLSVTASSTGSGYAGYLSFTPDSSAKYYIRISPYSSSSSYLGDYTLIVTPVNDNNLVTVTSPDSNSVWAGGTSYTITWDTTSVIGLNVSISLYEGGRSLLTLATGISNTGTYTWTIPSTLPTEDTYQIRVQDYTVPAMFGMSQPFTISGMPPDEYEDDNTREKAGTLEVGTVQQHSLTYNDTDWVTLTMTEDSVYYIRTHGTAVVRGYLYYYSATAASASFTASTSTRSGSLTFTCPLTGTYNLRLTPYSTSSSYHGDYTLSFYQGTDQGFIKVVDPASDAVWAAGSEYTITWDTTGIGYPSVEIDLLRGSTDLQNVVANTANDGNHPWTIPDGFETGDNYRIRVESDLSTDRSTVFGYSEEFTISGITPDEYEPDDSAHTGTPIATDGTEQERTISRNNVDWIPFVAEKDSIYQIACSGNQSKLLYLYATSTSSAALSLSGTNISTFWTAIVSDTVYLRVSASSTFGDYSVSIRRYSSADLLSFVEPTGDAVWNSGSNYSIEWNSDSILTSATVRIYLTRRGTRLYTFSSGITNTGTRSVTAPAGIMSGDEYQIEIQLVAANLTLSGFSEKFSISGIPADAYEPDDTPDEAQPITVDSTVQKRTLALADTDWCNFTAKPDHLYLLTMYGITNGSLALYNETGSSQLEIQSPGSDSLASFFWFAQESGDYLIRTLGTGGDYQLSVKEYDSTRFQFNVTVPEADSSYGVASTITITWNGLLSASERVDIFLFNQNGIVQTIIADTPNDGSHPWTISSTLTVGEGYYVRIIGRLSSKIEGKSGTFQITE